MSKINQFHKSVDEIYKKAQTSSMPDILFAVNWTHHIVNVIRKHRKDKQFVNEVITTSSEYFKDKMDDQQKTDIFCSLLGMAVSNGNNR